MLRPLLIALGAFAFQVQAVSFQLEKHVALSAITAVPSTVTYKIYASNVAPLPITQQSFVSGAWEADYDFTHFQTAAQASVLFTALFTNTAALDPNANYFYEIELDGVAKGARERLDNQAWLLFKEEVVSHTTALLVDCACQNPLPADVWTKIDDLGSFTKLSPTSLVEVDFNGTLWSNSINGTGIAFEIRIDNLPTGKGRIRTLIRHQNQYEPSATTGVFTNLAAGVHQVSLWARSANGTAGQTCVDPGCFSTDQVLIKEYAGK